MLNKVILQGRLVADIELKYTQSNTAFTEFTVAWSEKYKEVENKCFLRCKAWRNTAEFLEKYFRKGQELLIEGRMVTEQWESDGEKKSRTICQTDKVNFCGKREDKGGPYNAQSTNNPDQSSDGFTVIPDNVDEELPFN